MNQIVNWLTGICIGLVAYIVYDEVTFDNRIPVERWISTEAVNSPIIAGQDLTVRIDRIKVRDDCPVASERQVIDEDGRATSLQSGVSVGGSPEADSVVINYPTPRTLREGKYVLRVFLTYTCEGFVWTTQQPDTPFRIERNGI